MNKVRYKTQYKVRYKLETKLQTKIQTKIQEKLLNDNVYEDVEVEGKKNKSSLENRVSSVKTAGDTATTVELVAVSLVLGSVIFLAAAKI